MNYHQARYRVPLILEFEDTVGDSEFESELPEPLLREDLNIPNLREFELTRHYLRLSQMNFGVDTGFYPLGSCTMKHTPKILERIATSSKARFLHPHQDWSTVQGALQILYELQGMLATIGGVHSVTLQPAAGAHGEFTGLLIARAYHEDRGEERTQVVLPDSAHGTNPASASMLGFEVIEIPSKDGRVDLSALENSVGEKTSAFMITNPNTLGLFESDILQIARIVHEAGAILYYDGANLNAIMGRTNPGRMNFDIVHFNLHKTFATPHGGGGPGAGPIGVVEKLDEFLPVPIVAYDGERYYLDYDRLKSVGKVRSFLGNFAVLLKAYAYIKLHGGDGLKRISERAVLNSNYLSSKLREILDLPFEGLRKHEFVVSASRLKEKGVRAKDVCKRLIDFGFHPPTAYFPQLVDEALMIEPTESETKETLDRYAKVMEEIVKGDPETTRNAPHNASVKRVDEVAAARKPVLSFKMMGK
ncbi:MAG: aminomethyl-transferring glycine dehydrogenase subunit GcvPB [Thermoplasmata archaeon]